MTLQKQKINIDIAKTNSDFIDGLLENPVTVAVSLLIGGIILLKVDDWFAISEGNQTTQKVSNKFGIRKIEVVGNQILLNGESINSLITFSPVLELM